MRVGFCGSQRGMTPFQSEELKKRLEGCTEFIFGDCIGSDWEAANIAIFNVQIFTIYPQNINTKKRAFFYNKEKDIKRENGEWLLYPSGLRIRWMPAGKPLERNKLIVDNCDKLIATPKEFEHTLRSGTWNTIRYAWKTKKEVLIIPPVIREET